jgi:hypothetical protein
MKNRWGLIIMGFLEDLAKYGYKPDMKTFKNKNQPSAFMATH